MRPREKFCKFSRFRQHPTDFRARGPVEVVDSRLASVSRGMLPQRFELVYPRGGVSQRSREFLNILDHNFTSAAPLGVPCRSKSNISRPLNVGEDAPNEAGSGENIS